MRSAHEGRPGPPPAAPLAWGHSCCLCRGARGPERRPATQAHVGSPWCLLLSPRFSSAPNTQAHERGHWGHMPGLGQPTQSPPSMAWVLPGPLPVSGHLSGSRHQGGRPAALGASPRPRPLASPEMEPAGHEAAAVGGESPSPSPTPAGAPTQRGSAAAAQSPAGIRRHPCHLRAAQPVPVTPLWAPG